MSLFVQPGASIAGLSMKVRESRRDRRWIRAFFVLVALPFLGVSPYIGVVNNPNENVRTYMTMAIVENHTFRVDEEVRHFGWVNDMARVPGKNRQPDHVYSVKGPAVSYAGVPVYYAFRKVAGWLKHTTPRDGWKQEERDWWLRSTTFCLRLLVVQLPCFCFLVWFERYLRTVTSDLSLRLSAVAAVGLGTNYLAYAQAFVSHSLFGVAAFLAFALPEMELRRFPRHRSAWRAFLAGWFCGLATLLEYHALPVSIVLAMWGVSAFYRPTRLAAFAFGGLLNAGAMMFFQWRAYGSPFLPGHKMVESAAFSAQTHTGIFGLTKPAWEPFKLLSVDTSFGFFGTSPYMWLGLLAIPFALVFTFGSDHVQRVRRRATFVWVFAMLALWLILSGAVMWRGGWTVGPRYLGAAPPFFAFGATCALEKISRAGALSRATARGIAGGLALASVLTIGFVSLVYNTLPPSLIHPLGQFALPLARAGFVGHHVMEWIGWRSTTYWYVAAAALFSAPLIAATVRSRRSDFGYGWQLAFAAFALFAGLLPQLVEPQLVEPQLVGHQLVGHQPLQPSTFDLRPFVTAWEPSGRDRVTSLRAEAERYGSRRPCLWYRLADLEASLTLASDAARDRARAGVEKSICAKRFLGW